MKKNMTNSWRCFTTKWDTECIFLFVSFVYVLREPIQRKITDIMLLNIVFNSRWLFDGFLAPAWGHVVAKVRFFSFSLLVSTCPENENDQKHEKPPKTPKTPTDPPRAPESRRDSKRNRHIPRDAWKFRAGSLRHKISPLCDQNSHSTTGHDVTIQKGHLPRVKKIYL